MPVVTFNGSSASLSMFETPTSILSNSGLVQSSGTRLLSVVRRHHLTVNAAQIILPCILGLGAFTMVVVICLWMYRSHSQGFSGSNASEPLPMFPATLRMPVPAHTHQGEAHSDPEWLPPYEAKDAPPKYQEAVAGEPSTPPHDAPESYEMAAWPARS